MSNVLDETTQQQVIALGRLGWSLRRIEAATGMRRETISGYLKAAIAHPLEYDIAASAPHRDLIRHPGLMESQARSYDPENV